MLMHYIKIRQLPYGVVLHINAMEEKNEWKACVMKILPIGFIHSGMFICSIGGDFYFLMPSGRPENFRPGLSFRPGLLDWFHKPFWACLALSW